MTRAVRVDRSAPNAAIAGIGEQEFAGERDYRVDANGSDSVSGVQSVVVALDGVERGRCTDCPAGANVTCTVSFTLAGADPSLAEGEHTITTTVTDLAGNPRTATRTFRVDRNAPAVSVSHEGLAPWLDADREVATTVTGTDSGSGVRSFTLDFPAEADETRDRGCAGPSTNPCSAEDSETFTHRTDPDAFPQEGRHQLRAAVADAAGNSASSEPWEVNIDRTPPDLELSGALYDRRGEELPEGSYGLDVAATDGDRDSGSAADERSGLRDLDVYVDGELVESRSQPCPQGSCPLSLEWTFDSGAQTGGEHTIEVRASDHLDHVSVQQFEVSTACCLGAASSWGTIFGPLDDVVFGDADGDGFADAVTRKGVTGALTVSRSTGSSFGTEQSWGMWSGPAAGAELRMGDVNGDVRDDLIVRDPADGKVHVALSTGSSFEPPTEWGTWPGGAEFFVEDANGDGSADIVGRNEGTGQLEVAGSLYFDEGGEERFEAPAVWSGSQPGLELAPGDADFDDAADLVGRAADGSLQVGSSSTIDFKGLTSWGSLSTDQELLVGDVNADGTADAVGRLPSSGEVQFATSDGEAFAAPERVGTFDRDYPVELADVDGDGDTDLVGRHELTGDIKVALSNTRPAPVEPAPDWTPDPEIDYDDSNLFPEVGGFGIQQAAEEQPKQMQLAMEDPTHTLLRRGLVEGDPFSGEGEQAANDKIDVIYDRMNRTGTSIVRMLVYWGYFENADGTFDPEALDRLSKAVDRAKAPDNNMRVYLTLTGAAERFECQTDFNPRSRVCTDPDDPNVEPCGAPDPNAPGATGDTTPTGYDPNPTCFANFVRAVVERVGDRVKTYSIWNEPNQPRFLRTDDRLAARVVPADLYRDLYRAGREAVLEVQPNAKVMIGELASARRPGGFEPFSPDRDGVTAHEFLAHAADPTGTSEGLVTDGVALHPYQHRAPPRQSGERFVAGIGKIDITQDRIDDLFDKGVLCAEKRLRTPACKRPGLLYTEFGYRNRSEKRVDTLTEIERDGYYDVALRRARFNEAKWTSIYQVVEDPIEDPNDRTDEFKEEYGLFSLEGAVSGTRSYGKGQGPGYDHPQRRRAYCDGIYKFVSAHPNQYTIAERPESGCG